MSEELKRAIVARAREFGFDFCRFARAEPPPHAQHFKHWLEDGRAGEMNYLARGAEKRLAPEKILPGICSIIVLGLNYFQGLESGAAEPGRQAQPAEGRIARYAWGDDYHGLVEAKLRALSLFLESHGGTQKFYVDTGPILERDYAAAAGAGWQGKNTMLLNRDFGTWLFLAEILTTLELAPDPPVAAHCGKCTRCLDACPTGALTAPHQLDARLCISYLTIELKGSIPLALRPLIGDRIYGCDDCLEVCPWNRFAKVSREVRFAQRPEVRAMKLRDYLALDGESFRTLFRNSPIKRTNRRGLLRNVCVALGNVGNSDDLPALHGAARDPEPLVAEHARWAIGEIEKRLAKVESKETVSGIG